MRNQNTRSRGRSGRAPTILILALLSSIATVHEGFAATTWDSQSLTTMGNPTGSGTQWWFDPLNWSSKDPGETTPNYLPPSNDMGAVTDTQINSGTTTLPGGEGVVYDPSPADPNWTNVGGINFPDGFGAQTLRELYISRNTTNHNLLTIKGDLTATANVIVGRSGSTLENQNLGTIIQQSGTVKINNSDLDIGSRETSGWGNGVYDYRGGILEQGLDAGRFRLSAGGSTGTGGHGRLIMHNPVTPGYVRAYDLLVAAHAGQNGIIPDGVTTGVGILEFHVENGGTRPLQIVRNLEINNGMDDRVSGNNGHTRSSRLDLVLSGTPPVDGDVPANLGLIDVDFDNNFDGGISGVGTLGNFFSKASDPSFLYDEGAMVSGTFGGSTYNWTISYTGNITWDDANLGDVGTVTGPNTGTDVVLIGHSIVSSPIANADFDGDGDVDGRDLLTWQRNLGANAGQAGGDADNSGLVDAADLTIWRDQFGVPPASATIASIPEPASAAMTTTLLTAFAALLRRRAK